MYDAKTIRRRRAVLALLVVASIVLLTASFGGSGPFASIQRGVFEVVSPIQDGASRALKPFRDLFGWVGDTMDAKGENEDLKKERDVLRKQAIDVKELQRQNAELRGLLRLGERVGLDGMGPVTARVSATSPTVWYQQIVINKGTGAGVSVGDPVVTDDGLVGTVSTAGGGSSVVKLLSDSSFRVAAEVNDSGVRGVVRPASGSQRDLILDYTTSRDEVAKGQKVVTRGTRLEGFGRVFPPDVPIGVVTRVDDPGTDAQEVHLRPYVDVRDLTYVQVLTAVPEDAT